MNNKITLAAVILSLIVGFQTISHAAEHSAGQHSGHAQQGSQSAAPLTEAGNDAYGTLQEALQKLLADPKTDWSKVNMEALRQHLVDMNNFTANVDIARQTPVKNGVEVILVPHNKRVVESLKRMFAAHPQQLKNETGWDMKIIDLSGSYKISITTKNLNEVKKIQGLGYIGIMAWGNHHQAHHWMMAKGGNPH